MPVLPLLFAGIFLVFFVIAVFVVTWYLAIPLLLLWVIWGGLQWMREKGRAYYLNRDSGGCVLRRTHNKSEHKQAVIDVDYTEIT